MRTALVMVLVFGLLGGACGGETSGPDSGPCDDYNERLCAKGAECMDGSGQFTVAVGISGSGTYKSASQCENFAMISESRCNDASESEQQACDTEISAAQCDGNSIYVDEPCEF